MAHRADRDREPGREPGRETGREPNRDLGREPGRDLGRDRERDRPVRGDRDRREPVRDRPSGLNEFFVDGDGIHRDVMQREICKYLGPEAYSRPGTYNGTNGYIVTAVRPFTPKMIDDLQVLSEDWVSENRDLSRRGYEGVPYPQSQTSWRSDRSDPSLQGFEDTHGIDSRPFVPTPYSSASVQANYTTTAGYQPSPGYPSPQQVSGYPPTTGYAPVPTYPPNNAYPQGTLYPSNPVYPTASGVYSAPGFTAPVGRPGNPNDQNYMYDAGDYPNQGYQYRQQGAYPPGAPPRDPRSDPRTDPRVAAAGYPYVSSPQDVPMRGAPIDDRYGAYGQTLPTTSAGRGGFPAPARGPSSGGYEAPSPRDGFDSREPVRDDRRRR